MARARRILAVTGALAAAGALTGAVCGVLALTPIMVPGLLRGNLGAVWSMLRAVAPLAAGAGAVFGMVWGPLLAWTLLPHVALWRVIVWAAGGTVVGSFYGLAAAITGIVPGIAAVLSGGLLGMAVAGTVLKRRVAKETRGAST